MPNYLKHGLGETEAQERQRSLWPRSERQRASYGSLEMSLQTSPGLCPQPKCVKREGHSQECWPKG